MFVKLSQCLKQPCRKPSLPDKHSRRRHYTYQPPPQKCWSLVAHAGAGGGDAESAPVLLNSMRWSFSTKSANSRLQPKPEDGPRVLVLGAGVAGLTVATRLLEALPQAQVTVCADKFGSDITSHGAAGVWQPYKLSETPEALTDRWGHETFQHLVSLVHSPEAVQAGVQMCYCHSLFLAPEPDPFWASSVQGFRRMSPEELRLFSHSVDWPSIQAAAAAAAAMEASSSTGSATGDGSIDSFAAAATASAFVDGHSFNTVVCEGRLYTRWLTQRLTAAGVTLVQRRLNSLADVASEGWDLVFNCTGLGARELLPDPHCYPIRGQIMRVKAPWVNQCVFAHFPDEETYIIPNREWVVLGGTGQVGSSSTAVSLADASRIADRAIQVVPSLQAAEVLDSWVGLRPGRVRLRLELEELSQADLLEAAERVQQAAVAASARSSATMLSGSQQGEGMGSSSSSSGSGSDSGRLGSERGSRRGGLRVVHCYGHGGSGLTLAFGTAGDAVQLALTALGIVTSK